MATKTCQFSGEAFEPNHGNEKYLPGTGLSYEAKKERQSKSYPIGNDAKKAILKNHKLFMNFLGDNKSGEFDLWVLLKLGFDHNGYYGSGKTADTKKHCFKVHDFYFHITADNPQKIQIWKISTK